jgi:hypothetical protein
MKQYDLRPITPEDVHADEIACIDLEFASRVFGRNIVWPEAGERFRLHVKIQRARAHVFTSPDRLRARCESLLALKNPPLRLDVNARVRPVLRVVK